MSMKDKAKDLMQTSLGKMEKATGKALGDEDMPAKDQVEEVKSQLKIVGDKVLKSTGKALGDQDMPAKDQVEEVKSQVKQAAIRVRDALKKNG
ncbi:MAG: hypothetical protein HKL85_08390 [Acidimicrobiaceae bacterium]|nr:hypothetical protein [Acidimicrobiaceae bacterium]